MSAVELTRAQVLGVTLLACIPLPLFSLATTVVPLPEVIERAAASFVPFVSPPLGEQSDRVVRQRASELSPLERLERSERGTAVGASSPQTSGGQVASRSSARTAAEEAQTEQTQPRSNRDGSSKSPNKSSKSNDSNTTTAPNHYPASLPEDASPGAGASGDAKPGSDLGNPDGGKASRQANETKTHGEKKADQPAASNGNGDGPSGGNQGGNGKP